MTNGARSGAKRAGAVVVAALTAASVSAAPPALEYINQAQVKAKTKNRSGIMTNDYGTDGKFRPQHVWDFQFDAMVNDAVSGGVREIVFNFNQCYGGGMIDELVARNLPRATFTSAARHDQLSRTTTGEDLLTGVDPFEADIRRAESSYSFRWITKASNKGSARQIDAATKARAEDINGPFSPNMTYRNQASPQYTSTGADADDMRLFRGPKDTKFKAILWGGNTQLDKGSVVKVGSETIRFDREVASNWNSLERAYAALKNAGYTDEDIWVMYPGGHVRGNDGKPTGKIRKDKPDKIPAWVDAGTRYVDMKDAWGTWLKPQVDDKTQVLFWSSFGHGNSLVDAKAQRDAQDNPKIGKGQAFNFEMDLDLAGQMREIYDHYTTYTTPEDDGYGGPTFVLESLLRVPILDITLNGSSLPLLYEQLNPEGSWVYTFALPSTSIDQLQSLIQEVAIDYDFQGSDGGLYNQFADFITLMGPTSGGFANGPTMAMVPAPGALGLLGVAAVLGGRRRRA